LYDALAAAVLLLSLGRRPEFSRMTVPWLLQLSTANALKRAALQQDDLF
jgi:DNA polymerase-3 subunit epsilon